MRNICPVGLVSRLVLGTANSGLITSSFITSIVYNTLAHPELCVQRNLFVTLSNSKVLLAIVAAYEEEQSRS